MYIRLEDIQKNFDIGDVVVIDNPNCILNNEFYNLREENQVVLNKPYKIIDYDIELGDEYEVLYTLQDTKTGVCCGVMFNDWEIEKVIKE